MYISIVDNTYIAIFCIDPVHMVYSKHPISPLRTRFFDFFTTVRLKTYESRKKQQYEKLCKIK